MATGSDKRIMQMEFDNKEFELNIKKSQKSVEDFKKAMNFDETSKGLEKFSGALDKLHLTDAFSKMGDNLQKLTDKFTGLGTMSERVLSQIRSHLDNMMARLSNFIDSMTSVQVSAGMDKYEMLNKSVQTIKAATGKSEKEVYSVLERLNNYTDQTSYNFADMASNIGKFTSVGIDLVSAERQMEGIANWAARSGAGINEASRAMYNLSQAMGVGKLTKIDWKSIENAGMATKEFKEQLIEAGVLAGTIIEEIDKKTGKTVYKTAKSLGKQVEVNFQNVAETLSKGWATRDVVSSTLERYYFADLYYEEQDQKAILDLNETQQKAFKEMMDSNGALDASEYKTLQNMGVMTEENKEKILDLAVSYHKLTTEVDDDGKTIYKAVDKTGKEVKFTVKEFEQGLKAGWFDKKFGDLVTSINKLAKESYESAQKCLTFTDVLNAWKDQISTGWMKSFTIIFGELSDSMEVFSNICNKVGEGLEFLIETRNGILQSWSENGGRSALLDIILGDYGKDVETGAFGFLDILQGIGKMIYDGFVDFIGLFAGAGDRELFHEEPGYFRAYLGKMLASMTENVQNFLKSIRDFMNEEVEVNGKSRTRLQMVQEMIQGISGALALGWMVIKEGAAFIGEIASQLEPGTNQILALLADLGIAIYNTADDANKNQTIKTFFSELAVIIQPLSDSLNGLITSLVNLLRIIFGLDSENDNFSDSFHTFGEAIKSVADIIVKFATPIIDFITHVVDAISKLVSSGISGDSLKQFGSDLGTAFGDMMNQFADALPEKLNFLSDWIHGLFGGSKQQLEAESTNLFSLIGGVQKKADDVKDGAKKSEDNTGSGLLGLLTGTNVAVWAGVAALISITLLINKAKKTVGKIGGFFSSLGSALSDGFKIKYEQDDSASKFLKIAKALALIAGAIVVLGLIPISALIQGGIAMAAIIAAMIGTMFLLKKMQKSLGTKEQLALAAQIMAIAASAAVLGIAVGILAVSLIPFALMSWDQYAHAMAGLAGVLLQLTAFMLIIKKFKIGNIKMAGFVGFAYSIGILVKAIVPFATMSWDQYAHAMAGLGGVFLQILAFMELFKHLGLSTKAMNFQGLIKFALSIAILVFAIKPFASMDWDQYARVMAGLGGVFLEILAFMEIFKVLGLSTKALNFQGIMKFVLSIAILVFAIKPFASMNWDQYARVMAGLGGVLLEILAFMEIFKILGLSTKALNFQGLMGFVASIAVLVFAIKPFASMTWDQYALAMAGLGGVLLELIAAMFLIKKINGKDGAVKLAGFVLFAFSLKFLIDAIIPFTKMNMEQFIRAISGLGWVLLELAGFMGILKLIGTNNVQVLGLAGFAAGLSTLVTSLKPFAEMEDWSQFAKALAGLAGILAIMLGFMVAMKAVKPNTKNMLQMAIFAGIFAAIVGIFAVALMVTKDMDWNTISAFASGLSIVIVAIGAIGALLGHIGAAAALKGMAVLAVGIALIIGVLAVTVPLLITNIASGLGEAMGHLVLIADMIEMFVTKMGGINNGDIDNGIATIKGLQLFIDGFTHFSFANTGLDNFYTALFRLGVGVENFNKHTSALGDMTQNEGLVFIRSLAACAEDLDTIEKMNIEKFQKNLTGLGGALMLYAQGAKEAGGLEGLGETTDVTAVVGLLQAISTSLAEAGGFTIPENMPSDDVLSSFGTSLAALAGSFKIFEEAGTQLGAGYQNGKKALEFFRDLKQDLEYYSFNENLIAVQQEFSDGASVIQPDVLITLGADIEALGSAMALFAGSTTIIDEETSEIKPLDFTSALQALDSFVQLQKQLPTIGGVITGLLFGDEMTLGKLSGQIVELGTGLNEFSLTVSGKGGNAPEGYNGIDEESIGIALDTVDRMVTLLTTLSTKLPNIGGLVNIVVTSFVGRDFNLSDLSKQMSELAKGLGDLGTQLNTGTWDSTTGVENAFSTMDSMMALMLKVQQFAKQAKEMGLTTGISAGSAAFVAFTNLSQFIDLLTGDNYSGIFDDRTMTQIPLLEQFGKMVQMVDAEIYELTESTDDLDVVKSRMEIFRTFANGLSAITNSNFESGDWTPIGTKLTSDVAGAITEGMDNVTTAIQTMITTAWNTANNVPGVDWLVLGTNIAYGISNGMIAEAAMTSIINASRSVVNAAFSSVCSAAGISSPSKLFAELGAFMGEGLSIGIEKTENGVGAVSGEMAGVAIEKAKDMISLITSIMSEDVDMNPTISPVLDLTNLNSGLDAFTRDMQGRVVSLDTSGIALTAGSINAEGVNNSIDLTPLKPDFAGVYERMDILGQQINSLGDAISKIKIVLNTGVVAGSVTDDIDNNIGRKAFYAGRNF